ncbi:contractile injection system tape measure protein [Roseobacter weihaiensis]|uniref:contractile injection system tape measure protein n=1 Tax=Roseobacter weihaiensis TaxID=2763262 RepID=UPI001D0A5C9E|nr:contractile injection system tape measure protein [Roseobacter sp. H9]
MASQAQTQSTLQPAARIGICEARFEVTAARGPLSSPERLLAALRQEVLPALSEVLEAPDWADTDVQVSHLEIDLGDWPDDPIWSEVRQVLALKLRAALGPFARLPRTSYRLEQRFRDGVETSARYPASGPGTTVPNAPDQNPNTDFARTDDLQDRDGSDAPNRLSDVETIRYLRAFSKWIGTAPGAAGLTALKGHLADHPAEALALRVWLEAPTGGFADLLPDSAALRQQLRRALPAEATPDRTVPQTPAARSSVSAPHIKDTAETAPDQETRAALLSHQEAEADQEIRAALLSRLEAEADQGGPFQEAHARLSASLRLAGRSSDEAEEIALRLLTRILGDPAHPLSLAPAAKAPRPSGSSQTGPGDTRITENARPKNKASPPPLAGDKIRQVPTDAGTRPDATPPDDPSNTAKHPPGHQAAQPPEAADLDSLAQALGAPAGTQTISFLRDVVTRDPAQVFNAAQKQNALSALAWMLAAHPHDRAWVSGPRALETTQLRALTVADPAAIATALVPLTAAEARALTLRLLPQTATLLHQQLQKLDTRARAPSAAWREAALALLEGRVVDLETLQATITALRAETCNTPDTATDASKGQAPIPQSSATDKAPETPLEAFLELSGLTASEIARVLHPEQEGQGRAASTRPGTDPQADKDLPPETTAQPQTSASRTDAALLAHLERLAAVEPQDDSPFFDEVLALIWQAWPETTLPGRDGPAGQLPLMRARIAVQMAGAADRVSLRARLDVATRAIEEDPEKRLLALRTVAARLAGGAGPDTGGQRQRTRAAVENLLNQEASLFQSPQEKAPQPVWQMRPEEAPGPADDRTLLVTETAGLVLLHPFFTLLFERLEIPRKGKTLAEEGLGPARGALEYLAGIPPAPDPLIAVLLGRDPHQPLAAPLAPDRVACDLMEGLLRSVIDRWGRIGTTSPDGLRDTFLRRTGSLRFDATGAHLRVAPGPFDMLLDGLPWAPGPVSLPWMPLPCHVSWREDSDA